VDLCDVFRRIKFSKKTLSNQKIFIEYNVRDGNDPEDIALKFYGSQKWSWLVLFSNNYMDPISEWPKNSSEIQRFLKNSGKSYFTYDDKNFKSGDILAQGSTCDNGTEGCPDGITSSMLNYAIVDKWDPDLYKLSSSRIVGSLKEDDHFVALRKNTSGEYDIVTGHTNCFSDNRLSKVEKTLNYDVSASRFFNGVNEISPFADVTNFENYDWPTNGLCNATDSVLYNYINNDESAYEVVTELEDIYRNNDMKRNIQLIHPALKEMIFKEIKILIGNSNSSGKTTLLELV